VPFLTPSLARFVLSLPEEYLLDRDGTSKAVFRRAMRGIVPDAILDRRDKIGFAAPEHLWWRELSPRFEKLLADDSLARVPVLRGDALRAEWRAIRAGGARRDFRAWRWVNLVEWARRTGAEFA
jgi:asparagine synthase (glutamine-hydrolysing)